MATAQEVQSLKASVDALEKVDLSKLKRKNLGEASLENDLLPRLEEISNLKQLVLDYALFVHNQTVNQVKSIFDQIVSQLSGLASYENAAYITNGKTSLRNIDNFLEEAKLYKPAFVSAAIMERGFLEDKGIKKEYQRTIEMLKKESSQTIETIKQEAERTISEAKRLAEEIETKARRTAAKISVAEAQRQFKEAQQDLEKDVKKWGWLSVLAIIAFLGTATGFIFVKLQVETDWHAVIYQTGLRIVILSAVGAMTTFAMRMLRAHIHMSHLNKHRQRVANSIEAFVMSAQTSEQRDMLLSNLVEAVVAFGNSGLLPHDEDTLGGQKLPTETIGKILSVMQSKK